MLLRDLLSSWSKLHPEWDVTGILRVVATEAAQSMRSERTRPRSPMPDFEQLLEE